MYCSKCGALNPDDARLCSEPPGYRPPPESLEHIRPR